MDSISLYNYAVVICKLYLHAAYFILEQKIFSTISYFRRYISGTVSHESPAASGREGDVCVLTGGSSGIGRQTALLLMDVGYTVVVGCKPSDLILLEELENHDCSGQLIGLPLDLSSMQSVKEFADAFADLKQPLHLLINNAGVMFTSEGSSRDGVEIHWAVNYLSHVLLTQLLLPHMAGHKSPAHIVNLASSVHLLAKPEKVLSDSASHSHKLPGYCEEEAYFNSKLAVVWGTHHLRQLLQGRGIRVSCLHPGVVNSGLFRHVALNTVAPHWLKALLLMSVDEAASHVLRVAFGGSDAVYHNTSRPVTSLPASTATHAQLLWQATAKLLKPHATILQ